MRSCAPSPTWEPVLSGAPPEDWTGALDSVETDDVEEYAAEASVQPEDWFADDPESWQHLMTEEPTSADELRSM